MPDTSCFRHSLINTGMYSSELKGGRTSGVSHEEKPGVQNVLLVPIILLPGDRESRK
jgi:hypothetical protein